MKWSVLVTSMHRMLLQNMYSRSFICLVWHLNASSRHHSLLTWWLCLECHWCQIAWPMSLKDENVLILAFYCKEIPCLLYLMLTAMDIHIDSSMVRDLLLIQGAQNSNIVILGRHISSTSIHSTLWLMTLPLYFSLYTSTYPWASIFNISSKG